ncbi:hypothetical protein [Pontibacter chinhatensis]|uniref:Uncharacterized protein n=1 Tax=Pontibacter chinhatensis TaxID=1436961 RepID=A0A1I2R0A3_9BACT|nr:hypothetical protein [Pontibacter chinhatensis]SFG32939.1 hypothetical protein SAMN05421739_102182 [Pontibacter chinhatensis]
MSTFLLNLNPIQILNAFEAIHHFSIEDKDCQFLFKSQIGKTEELRKSKAIQLLHERPDIKWEVIETDGSWIGKIKQFNAFIQLIKNHKSKYKGNNEYRIFIGNYFTSLYRAVSNRIGGQLIVLDEGTTTLVVDLYRNKPISLSSRLKLLFNYDERFRSQLTFFTAMGKVNEIDTWLENTYSYFKKHLLVLNKNEEIWIIGTPLAELAYVSHKYYTSLIRNAVEPYINLYKIKYFLHGGENSQLKKKAFEGFGFDIINLNYPIELYLLKGRSIPYQVVSPFSSVNFYFSKMLSEKSKLIIPEIDEKEVSPLFIEKFKVIKEQQARFLCS